MQDYLPFLGPFRQRESAHARTEVGDRIAVGLGGRQASERLESATTGRTQKAGTGLKERRKRDGRGRPPHVLQAQI
jgi:hypothetical protein